MITFHSLGLSADVLRGVIDAGYTEPTPIQAESIPAAVSGRDLIGCAQTGTGKTAAFVLPMLHRLSERRNRPSGRRIRGLVVTPTRELALQVEDSVRTYGKFTGLRSLAVFGGVPMGPQFDRLRRGVDVVVATPGRLLDHLERGTIDLSTVEVLILDEADRMFDMGFIRDVRKIVSAVPDRRQTLLFSATMPPAIQDLARQILKKPALIKVGTHTSPAETVLQRVCNVRQDQKMDLLLEVLQGDDVENVLVFSRTKHRADRIVRKLSQQGFAAAVIHSNRSQGQRQRALDGFRSGRIRVLVATDIAARGIDVDLISHVVNYDTPNQAEDYIHRIGRTGRARSSGEAITFVAHEEESYLQQIERHTGKRFERSTFGAFDAGAPPVEHAGRRGGSMKKRDDRRSPGRAKRRS